MRSHPLGTSGSGQDPTAPSLVHDLYRRLGWLLMSYPIQVGWSERLSFKPPFWASIYRLGADIYNREEAR